jgi:hypothetical protein
MCLEGIPPSLSLRLASLKLDSIFLTWRKRLILRLKRLIHLVRSLGSCRARLAETNGIDPDGAAVADGARAVKNRTLIT